MKFINKKLAIYELFAIVSLFYLLTITGLIGYVLNVFELFINGFFEFDLLFISSILFGHFALSLFFFKKFKSFKIKFKELIFVLLLNYTIIILIGLILLNTTPTISISLSSFIIIVIAVYLGFLFEKSRQWLKRSVIFAILVFITYLNVSFVYPMQLQVQNHNSLTGIYSKNIDFNAVNFYDKNNKELNLNEKKAVLDFWHNSCGICIKKFPVVEKTKNEISGIKFYLVNVIENKSDIEMAEKILKDTNTTIENIYLYRDDLNLFDVLFFPTVILVDDDEIVFKGSIEGLGYLNFIKPL